MGSALFGTSRRLLVQLIIDAVICLAVRVLFMVGRPQIVAAFVNPGRFHKMAPPQVLFQHRVGCITVAPGRRLTLRLRHAYAENSRGFPSPTERLQVSSPTLASEPTRYSER